jgi:hypothetical protein
MLMMKPNDFDRINTLSEKVLNLIATPSELKEFYVLLESWKKSEEFNLTNGSVN